MTDSEIIKQAKLCTALDCEYEKSFKDNALLLACCRNMMGNLLDIIERLQERIAIQAADLEKGEQK